MQPHQTHGCEVTALRRDVAAAKSDRARLPLLLRLGRVLGSTDPAEAALREAARLARVLGSYDDLASAGRALCDILIALRRLDEAGECAGWVEEAARAAGRVRLCGSHQYLLGRIHEAMSEHGPARVCFEAARRAWQSDSFREGVGAALNQLGNLLSVQGSPAEALHYYQECLEIDDELDDAVNRVRHSHNVGSALQQLGRWEDAVECYYRALATIERCHILGMRSYVQESLGEIFLSRDKAAKAIDMLEAAINPDPPDEATSECRRAAQTLLGRAHYRQGDLAKAADAYRQSEESARAADDKLELAKVLWGKAELLLTQGDLEGAELAVASGAELASQVGLRPEESEALRVRALVAAAKGQPERARDSYERALTLLSDMEEGYELARVRFHYGRFLLGCGERESAVALLRASARVFRRLAVVAEAEDVNRLLFQQDMGADRDMALLSGISGLAAIGLSPEAFVERSLELLREGLGFESVVLVVPERVLYQRGSPDIAAAHRLRTGREVVSTPTTLSWAVGCGGASLGRVHMERVSPSPAAHNHLVLETVANLISGAVQRLTEVPGIAVEERAGAVGLKYRGVVGRSRRMLDCLETASRVAATGVPVLILGESGTGKELVARALHESSGRAGQRFVAINCAALPENLLEAEFFGVEKGVATGVAARKGRLEAADGGTVFLDEIGDMGLPLQAKLLRVLQERCFERVGGRDLIPIDIRMVAATNRDLSDLMKSGRFRADLYYRLNTVELELPALRDRREDIPELVRYFITKSNHEFGRSIVGANADARACFDKFAWPGNIRELEHTIERAVLLARSTMIDVDDLPASLQMLRSAAPSCVPTDLRSARRDASLRASSDIERRTLIECLERARWNVRVAAGASGYSRAQFYRLLQKHGITRPKPD